MTIAKFNELKCELLEDSLYLPDLAPSDYHMFSNLKTFLAVKRFSSNHEIAVERYFESFSNEGIELLDKFEHVYCIFEEYIDK